MIKQEQVYNIVRALKPRTIASIQDTQEYKVPIIITQHDIYDNNTISGQKATYHESLDSKTKKKDNFWVVKKFHHDDRWFAYKESMTDPVRNIGILRVNELMLKTFEIKRERDSFVARLDRLIYMDLIEPFLIFVNGKVVDWNYTDVVFDGNDLYLILHGDQYSYHKLKYAKIEMIVLPFKIEMISVESDDYWNQQYSMFCQYITSSMEYNEETDETTIHVPTLEGEYESLGMVFNVGAWFYTQLRLQYWGLLSKSRARQLRNVNVNRYLYDASGNLTETITTRFNALDKDSYNLHVYKQLCNIPYQEYLSRAILRFDDDGTLSDVGSHIIALMDDTISVERYTSSAEVVHNTYADCTDMLFRNNYLVFENGLFDGIKEIHFAPSNTYLIANPDCNRVDVVRIINNQIQDPCTAADLFMPNYQLYNDIVNANLENLDEYKERLLTEYDYKNHKDENGNYMKYHEAVLDINRKLGYENADEMFLSYMADEAMNFEYDRKKYYDENMSDAINTIMKFDAKFFDKLAHSRVHSTTVSGATANDSLTFALGDEDREGLKIPRWKFKTHETYVMVFVNGELCDTYYQMIAFPNYFFLPVNRRFDDGDRVEFLFFTHVCNNELHFACNEYVQSFMTPCTHDGFESKFEILGIFSKFIRPEDLKIFMQYPEAILQYGQIIDEAEDMAFNVSKRYTDYDRLQYHYTQRQDNSPFEIDRIDADYATAEAGTLNFLDGASYNSSDGSINLYSGDNYTYNGDTHAVEEHASEVVYEDGTIEYYNDEYRKTIFEESVKDAKDAYEDWAPFNERSYHTELHVYTDAVKPVEDSDGNTTYAHLTAVSEHKFIYQRIYVDHKCFRVRLDRRFKYCDNEKQYMLFINGRRMEDESFLVTIPKHTRPFWGMYLYVTRFIDPEDRVELFYVPEEVMNINTAHTPMTFGEDGYIETDKYNLSVPYNKDSYLFFVNGRKIPQDDLFEVDSGTLRVTKDTRTLRHFVVNKVYRDTYTRVAEYLKGRTEDNRDLVVQFIKASPRLGKALLDDLINVHTQMTDTEDDAITWNVNRIAIINEIVRDFWGMGGWQYNERPFVYDYQTDTYFTQDKFGNQIIPAFDATQFLNIEKDHTHLVLFYTDPDVYIYELGSALLGGIRFYWEYASSLFGPETVKVMSQYMNGQRLEDDARSWEYPDDIIEDMKFVFKGFTPFNEDKREVFIRFLNGVYYGGIDEDQLQHYSSFLMNDLLTILCVIPNNTWPTQHGYYPPYHAMDLINWMLQDGQSYETVEDHGTIISDLRYVDNNYLLDYGETHGDPAAQYDLDTYGFGDADEGIVFLKPRNGVVPWSVDQDKIINYNRVNERDVIMEDLFAVDFNFLFGGDPILDDDNSGKTIILVSKDGTMPTSVDQAATEAESDAMEVYDVLTDLDSTYEFYGDIDYCCYSDHMDWTGYTTDAERKRNYYLNYDTSPIITTEYPPDTPIPIVADEYLSRADLQRAMAQLNYNLQDNAELNLKDYILGNHKYFVYAAPTRLVFNHSVENVEFYMPDLHSDKIVEYMHDDQYTPTMYTDGTFNEVDHTLNRLDEMKMVYVGEFEYTNRFGYEETYTMWRSNGFFTTRFDDFGLDFYVKDTTIQKEDIPIIRSKEAGTDVIQGA